MAKVTIPLRKITARHGRSSCTYSLWAWLRCFHTFSRVGRTSDPLSLLSRVGACSWDVRVSFTALKKCWFVTAVPGIILTILQHSRGPRFRVKKQLYQARTGSQVSSKNNHSTIQGKDTGVFYKIKDEATAMRSLALVAEDLPLSTRMWFALGRKGQIVI